MLRVANVRLPVGESEESLAGRCARRLGISATAISRYRILRRALDVRDKRRLEYVYTLAVEAPDENRILEQKRTGVERHAEQAFDWPVPGCEPLLHRPLVVGAGPAGLFAALHLAEMGYCPLVIERGQPVHQRIKDVAAFDHGGALDPESNYLFGEGGAGTFSDGKLTCRNTGPDVTRVLEIFSECKGKPSILYEARPHLGSNRLPAVVKALRRRIAALAGEFRFDCRLDDLSWAGPTITAHTSTGPIEAEVCVLGIGHSARDTYRMLRQRGIALEPKPFQMGIRIEQPQANVDRFQYGTGPLAKSLGPADYSVRCMTGGGDVFSFCMCAGGYIMPSVSEPEHFCTNGMSRSRHESPYANSGIVATVDPSAASPLRADEPLAGMMYQAAIEHAAYQLAGGTYRAPIQWARDFVRAKSFLGPIPSSYARGVAPVNLWEFLPAELARSLGQALEILDDRWRGLFLENATVVGPEARGSSPVRIPRDPDTRVSLSTPGLYPVGEGAGYAGGIVSAAVDGLRSARAIIRRYAPITKSR